MATGQFNDFLYDDAVIPVNASGTALTITKGDWVAFSGIWAIAANTGIASYKNSGVGVALANNPTYDSQGVARIQTALPVLTRGIIRATGMSAVGDGSDILLGLPVKPITTGSGIVGQTGATGIGARWATAPLQGISANPTGAVASGVGKLVGIAAVGPTGQWDIQIIPQRPDYF